MNHEKIGQSIPAMSGGQTEVLAQRHDAHEKGHLTPEGHEHARQVALEVVNNYLDKNPDTHFLVVASDQVFDDDEPDFGGKRAHETAQEIIAAIKEVLAERGLPAEQLADSAGTAFTSTPNLREAGIFSTGFMKHLRETYPDEKPPKLWELYYQDTDAEQRELLGAESPLDLARRMDYMFKRAELVGDSFHKAPGQENKPLVVWIVGHGGGLDSYLHHYANVPLNELGFGLSRGFTMKANNEGVVVADVKGKEYPINTDDELNLPPRLDEKISTAKIKTGR